MEDWSETVDRACNCSEGSKSAYSFLDVCTESIRVRAYCTHFCFVLLSVPRLGQRQKRHNKQHTHTQQKAGLCACERAHVCSGFGLESPSCSVAVCDENQDRAASSMTPSSSTARAALKRGHGNELHIEQKNSPTRCPALAVQQPASPPIARPLRRGSNGDDPVRMLQVRSTLVSCGAAGWGEWMGPAFHGHHFGWILRSTSFRFLGKTVSNKVASGKKAGGGECHGVCRPLRYYKYSTVSPPVLLTAAVGMRVWKL